MNRYALTFDVIPGSEGAVRDVLSGYARPATQIDSDTRLIRTTIFMRGTRVVRVIDIEGELPRVLRHLAAQPEIREVERLLDPYLATPRDLDDPESARAFFSRAMMAPIVHRVTAPAELAKVVTASRGVRLALHYPVVPGAGVRFDDVLSAERRAELPVQAGATTALASTTVFRSGDVVVRLIEVDGDPDEALAHLSRTASRAPSTSALGALLLPDYDLSTEEGFRRFLDENLMLLVTDRRAVLAAS